MKQYIDKAALVAEIERRIDFFTEESKKGNSDINIAIALCGFENFLDSLEVKEVENTELLKVRGYLVRDKDDYTSIYAEKPHRGKTEWVDGLLHDMTCNPPDKVEPRFKVGDWITDRDIHCKISDVLDDRYIVDTKFGKRSSIPFKRENDYRLWTIQDAKDGDVLYCDNGNNKTIYLFKEQRGSSNIANAYFQILNMNNELRLMFNKAADFNLNTKPATKEQCDMLFQKTHEAGYMWDSESKQLLSLKAEPSAKQKPTWGEDDEDMIQALNACIDTAIKSGMNYISFDSKSILIGKVKNWLKSIKDRVQPKQEWGDEDERTIKRIDSLLYTNNESNFEDIHAWLESLKYRVQPKQEWSEEDEKIITGIINDIQERLEDYPLEQLAEIYFKEIKWLKAIKQRMGG